VRPSWLAELRRGAREPAAASHVAKHSEGRRLFGQEIAAQFGTPGDCRANRLPHRRLIA
jgi:hypothetical protein